MKHLRPFVLLSIILCLGVCVVHCDKDSGTNNGNNDNFEENLVGTWTLATMTIPNPEGGDPITVPAAFAGISMVVTINANGTYSATVNFGDGEDTENGTWSATATTLTLTAAGEEIDLPYTLSGNTLTLVFNTTDMGIEIDLDEDGTPDDVTLTLTFTK